MEVGGEGDCIPIATRLSPLTRMTSALRPWAAMPSQCFIIVRDKVTRQCPQTTTFEVKGEPKRQIRTGVLLLTSLTPYR